MRQRANIASLYKRWLVGSSSIKIRTWIPRIGYSIADQSFISGANFILNILLAKWISPDDYGLFAITYSIFLFISGFHNSLLIDPLGVIGPTKYENNMSRYMITVIFLHLVFVMIVTAILLLVAPLLMGWQPGITFGMIIALCISNFIILLFWLLRRASYLDGNAGLACFGSFFYLCVQLVGMWLLRGQRWLTVTNAYLLMSSASLIASVILWHRLGIKIKDIQPKEGLFSIRSVFVEHWQYGRWIVAGTVAYSFSTLIYVPLVGTFVGLAASGALKAMQNLVQPVQQIIIALSTFFVPWLSKQKNIRGRLYPLHILPQMLMVFSGIGILFLLPIALWGQELVRFMYSNVYYSQYTSVLYLIGIATMIQVLVYAIATVARSLEFSDAIFGQHLAGACFVLTIGIILVWKWELMGASISLAGSALSQLIVMIWFMNRKIESGVAV